MSTDNVKYRTKTSKEAYLLSKVIGHFSSRLRSSKSHIIFLYYRCAFFKFQKNQQIRVLQTYSYNKLIYHATEMIIQNENIRWSISKYCTDLKKYFIFVSEDTLLQNFLCWKHQMIGYTIARKWIILSLITEFITSKDVDTQLIFGSILSDYAYIWITLGAATDWLLVKFKPDENSNYQW